MKFFKRKHTRTNLLNESPTETINWQPVLDDGLFTTKTALCDNIDNSHDILITEISCRARKKPNWKQIRKVRSFNLCNNQSINQDFFVPFSAAILRYASMSMSSDKPRNWSNELWIIKVDGKAAKYFIGTIKTWTWTEKPQINLLQVKHGPTSKTSTDKKASLQLR